MEGCDATVSWSTHKQDIGSIIPGLTESSSQQSLFTHYNTGADMTPNMATIQRLYGSLGQLQHGSRVSLPDIAEGDEGRHSLRGSDQDLFALDQHSVADGGTTTSAPPSLPDLALMGQLPSHDELSRTLLVRGLPANVTEQQVRTLFENFGEIASLYTASTYRGYVMLSYHDIRAATLAHHTLHGAPAGQDGTYIDVVFSPGPCREGSVVVGRSSSSSSSSDHTALPTAEIWQLFSLYGEIKDVTDAPDNPGFKLVEFYDARHATSARAAITRSPDLGHKLLVLDAGAPPTQVHCRSSSSELQFPDILSQVNLGARTMGSTAASFANQQQRLQSLSASSQLMQGAISANDLLAGMSRSLSEMSLDGAMNRNNNNTVLGSMSTGDLLHLSAAQQGPSSVAGLRGIASTGSLWPQASALGSSPASSGVWPNDMTAVQLQEALAQQQQLNVALIQQHQRQQAQQLVALQQALVQQQVAGSYNLNSAFLGNLNARRVEPPLGGRLARRPLDAGAEAERRAQQERLYSLDIVRINAGEDKRTTLMIKNIPNKYTQKMLLSLLEEKFRGTFDFFYLPIDFKNKCNVGYAFINMTSPRHIPPLVEEFHGKKWPKFNSEKVCAISYGRIQGKSALVAHFQNSSLLHEDKRCRPVLFVSMGDMAGEPEPFPLGPL